MKFHILSAAVVACLASPLAAQAQEVPDGIAHGVYVGSQEAGPVGAVVGGAVGSGVEGVLGIGPYSGAYPEAASPVYRHRVRQSYRHVRSRHANG